MGQQQLLLIILGLIVVGIGVAIGITMFEDNAVSSNREALANDLVHLATKARHYYNRPASMGGGGHSFTGITMDKLVTPDFSSNINGIYSITAVSASEMTFLGVGKVVASTGDSTRLSVTVRSGSTDPIVWLTD